MKRQVLVIYLMISASTPSVAQPVNATSTSGIDITELPIPIEVKVVQASVNNEPLIAERFGTPGGKVVVAVGSIHGHEKTGIQIVRELQLQPVSTEYDLWVIDSANPDGNRANTRQSANGVDLNRNFPKLWRKRPVRRTNGIAKPRAVRAYSRILSLQITNDFCGLSDCSGNATQYLTATIPSSTSFVVELPCHDRCLKDSAIQRHIQGFWSAAEQS